MPALIDAWRWAHAEFDDDIVDFECSVFRLPDELACFVRRDALFRAVYSRLCTRAGGCSDDALTLWTHDNAHRCSEVVVSLPFVGNITFEHLRQVVDGLFQTSPAARRIIVVPAWHGVSCRLDVREMLKVLYHSANHLAEQYPARRVQIIDAMEPLRLLHPLELDELTPDLQRTVTTVLLSQLCNFERPIE